MKVHSNTVIALIIYRLIGCNLYLTFVGKCSLDMVTLHTPKECNLLHSAVSTCANSETTQKLKFLTEKS